MTGTTNVRSALLVVTFAAALLGVAVAGGVGVGEATAQQTVGECREINDTFVGANSTVELQNDLQASGDCLTVTADGVTVDGNGYTVNGSGAGTGVVVAAENVDVVDLTVGNFTTGVRFGAAEVPASGTVDARVANNTRGVDVANVAADGVSVAGAEVEENADDGVLVDAGSGQVEVVNARIADNGGTGVYVADHAEGSVLVETSRVLGNAGAVTVVDSRNVTLRGNEVVNSASNAALAVRGFQSDANHTVADNSIESSRGAAVLVRTGGVTVRGNDVDNTGAEGVLVEGDAPDVRLVDNEVRRGSYGLVVDAYEGAAPTNTTVVGDRYVDALTGVQVSDAPDTTLRDVVVEGAGLGDGIPLPEEPLRDVRAPTLDGDRTLATGATVLAEHSLGTTRDGIVLYGATDPRLESVSVRGVSDAALAVGGEGAATTGARVVGGEYVDSRTGIAVAAATDTRIEGVTVTGNGGVERYGVGIELGDRYEAVRNTTVVGGTVADNGIGVVAENTTETTVRGVAIQQNFARGVDVSGGTDVVFDDVTVRRNGAGIQFGPGPNGPVDGAVVRDSTVVRSGVSGEFGGEFGSLAGAGITAFGTQDLLVTRTNVSENLLFGVAYGTGGEVPEGPRLEEFTARSQNGTVEDVTVRRNGVLGVGVDGAAGTTVANVTATGNGEFGIVVNRDPDATVRDSVARDNGAGILAGDGVRVVDTTAANNSGGGIPGVPVEFYGRIGAPGVDLVDVRAEDGVAAENLTVGNATLSGTLTRVNVTGVAPPAGPPGDRVRLGGNADVDPHAEGAYADLRVGYTDAEAVPADEANASLYHYNGTAWVPVDGSTPDPAANAVAGNVTAFSNVSAFAEPDDPPVARLSATQSGGSVVFDASNSTDPDSAIDRYEWDFDGDGSYEETTTAPTTTHAYESGGSYDATVRVVSKDLDDTASVTVDVGGYGDGGDATDLGSRISIESVEADSDEVQAGDSVRVTARLRNRGQGDDNVVVRLTSDGERVESRTITVPGGERRTVTFDRRFDEPGEYGLSVNGRSLGTVRVLGDAGSGAPTPTPTETPTDSPTPGPAGDGTTAAAGGGSGSGESGETTPTEGGGPGFGAVGALAALLALAALAARRRT